MCAITRPLPYFGGKSKVADLVWDRFGNVANYVECFAGSLAVLLHRPNWHGQTETVNDADCYLSCFWRALQADPEGVAYWADWPVNEADLHARHLWLVNQIEFREKMKTDPDYFDSKIAGWWVWGISQWIGSGWCSRPEWTGRSNAGLAGRGVHNFGAHNVANLGVDGFQRPDLSSRGVHAKRPLISGDNSGRGVHWSSLGNSGMGVSRQRPHLGDAGRGGEPPATAPGEISGTGGKLPLLSGNGDGCGVHSQERQSALLEYMQALSARLRRVRVCCGDWRRVLGPSVTEKHGVTGIFLDPPYDMRVVSQGAPGRDGAAPSDGLYANHDNDLSAAVRAWAIENGGNPLLRIALCGYQGEHDMPADWEEVQWKSRGGYGSQGSRGADNSRRERIWFNKSCLRQPRLF